MVSVRSTTAVELSEIPTDVEIEVPSMEASDENEPQEKSPSTISKTQGDDAVGCNNSEAAAIKDDWMMLGAAETLVEMHSRSASPRKVSRRARDIRHSASFSTAVG